MHYVTWVFRNDHQWTQGFEHEHQMREWINKVGLTTHPDIVHIEVQLDHSDKVEVLKNWAEPQRAW